MQETENFPSPMRRFVLELGLIIFVIIILGLTVFLAFEAVNKEFSLERIRDSDLLSKCKEYYGIQVYDPEEDNRISKGRLFTEVKEVIGNDCPIIIINHMTPFHDKYDNAYVIEFIKKMVGKSLMVCNSHEATQQWGFGKTIIHGFDINEWWDLPKEPRCVTVLTPAGMEKAYRRIFLHQVIRRLKEFEVNHIWIGVDRKFKSFNEYRNFLGRSLVYFNPTWQSPRSRARTEAMLSGCCIVTTPYHDADTFIKDGVNGFLTSKAKIIDPRIIDNPEYTADLIRDLILNRPKEALKIGQNGKKTAQQLFNKKEFEKQWEKIIKKLLE